MKGKEFSLENDNDDDVDNTEKKKKSSKKSKDDEKSNNKRSRSRPSVGHGIFTRNRSRVPSQPSVYVHGGGNIRPHAISRRKIDRSARLSGQVDETEQRIGIRDVRVAGRWREMHRRVRRCYFPRSHFTRVTGETSADERGKEHVRRRREDNYNKRRQRGR